MVSSQEGQKVAKEIGAKYAECSAKTMNNVNQVFDIAVRAAISPKKNPSNNKCCVL